MKAILLILTMLGFYGDDSSFVTEVHISKHVSVRPTLLQQIQLKENELKRVDSEIKLKLAEFKNNN